ncbi:MAG: hypothetical protein WCS03_13965 [Bacteroidota bacterium]
MERFLFAADLIIFLAQVSTDIAPFSWIDVLPVGMPSAFMALLVIPVLTHQGKTNVTLTPLLCNSLRREEKNSAIACLLAP